MISKYKHGNNNGNESFHQNIIKLKGRESLGTTLQVETETVKRAKLASKIKVTTTDLRAVVKEL